MKKYETISLFPAYFTPKWLLVRALPGTCTHAVQYKSQRLLYKGYKTVVLFQYQFWNELCCHSLFEKMVREGCYTNVTTCKDRDREKERGIGTEGGHGGMRNAEKRAGTGKYRSTSDISQHLSAPFHLLDKGNTGGTSEWEEKAQKHPLKKKPKTFQAATLTKTKKTKSDVRCPDCPLNVTKC